MSTYRARLPDSRRMARWVEDDLVTESGLTIDNMRRLLEEFKAAERVWKDAKTMEAPVNPDGRFSGGGFERRGGAAG